ncbi:MAG: hypothetical protein NVS9B15_03020 [Acidobacteriaceae bacterium]
MSAGYRQAEAQAIPVATADPISTGFRLPTAFGSLAYSVSASENLTSGYYGGSGWQPATGLNGNLALISSSQRYPTSLVFSGGRFWSTSNQPSTNFLDLAVSQVLSSKKWNVVATDSVAYLPATASVGLSGVPGVGDLGVPPIQAGINIGQGILTNYATRVSNSASLNVGRNITGKTSIQTAAAYTIQRYLDPPPGRRFDSDAYTGSVGLSHQLDGRSSLSGDYAYSKYSYLEGFPGFTSQTISAAYSRSLSRRLNISLEAGPQLTTGQFATNLGSSAAQQLTLAPSTTQTNIFISTSLRYSTRFAEYALNYARGTNAGYGVTQGSRSDSVTFSGSKTIARVWSASANAAYTRSTTLALVGTQPLSPQTFVVSAQTSRALARSISAYASYTLDKQSGVGSGFLFNVFSGSFQVIGFGLTYSPPALHFGNR